VSKVTTVLRGAVIVNTLSGVGPFKLVDMGYVPDVLYVHTLHEANG
jgi:hypothetical protein